MLRSFEYFQSLPEELQEEIWRLAIRPVKPGIQIFSLSNEYRRLLRADRSPEAPLVIDYYLAEPKWCFSLKSERSGPKATVSWAQHNPSTYLIDGRFWNACTQSRHVMRGKLAPTKSIAIWTRVDRGRLSCKVNALDVNALEGMTLERCHIVVSPGRDLFVLQLDDSNMFSWSLSDDLIPDGTTFSPMQIPHVGWEYSAAWTTGIGEFPRTQNLDSLCSYIVYGSRHGGLETLWLINRCIRRKHWVPSREELDKPEPQAFETDEFRLIEVSIDDSIDWGGPAEHLPWGEIIEQGGSYTLDDFLAFIHHLQVFTIHVSHNFPNLGTGKRSIGIKVLAYEERQ